MRLGGFGGGALNFAGGFLRFGELRVRPGANGFRSAGFYLRLGMVGASWRRRLLIQQIDLLLHDFIAVLQQIQQRLLLGQLLAQGFIFLSKETRPARNRRTTIVPRRPKGQVIAEGLDHSLDGTI